MVAGKGTQAFRIHDGFPCTVLQVEKLDAMLKSQKEVLDSVIELAISNQLLISCITGRLIHLPSRHTYHREFKYVNTTCAFSCDFFTPTDSHSHPQLNPYMECPTFSPQKKPMKDDIMGEPLIQQSDDNVEALTKCLGIFHMQTIPVVSCYHTITLRSIFFVMGSLDSAPDVSLCLRLFSRALEGFGMLSAFSSVSSCVLVQFPLHHTGFHKLWIIHTNHVHTTTNPIEKDAL